jgi:hypothetical protein
MGLSRSPLKILTLFSNWLKICSHHTVCRVCWLWAYMLQLCICRPLVVTDGSSMFMLVFPFEFAPPVCSCTMCRSYWY